MQGKQVPQHGVTQHGTPQRLDRVKGTWPGNKYEFHSFGGALTSESVMPAMTAISYHRGSCARVTVLTSATTIWLIVTVHYTSANHSFALGIASILCWHSQTMSKRRV